MPAGGAILFFQACLTGLTAGPGFFRYAGRADCPERTRRPATQNQAKCFFTPVDCARAAAIKEEKRNRSGYTRPVVAVVV